MTTQSTIALAIFGSFTLNVSIVDVPVQPQDLDPFIDVLQTAISNSVEQPSNGTLLAVGNVAIQSRRLRRRLDDTFSTTIDIGFRLDAQRDCLHAILAACDALAGRELVRLEDDFESAVTNGTLTNLLQAQAAADGIEPLTNAAVVNLTLVDSNSEVREYLGPDGEDRDIEFSSAISFAVSLSLGLLTVAATILAM